ncbi:tetratricopeptide repeat protein [Sinomicrobium soli]|uniref:tetratricopeptide repeat protein n=1 Tax=Sinomicrobium sp. N-1-3-6 TaxID=2219864 RepID=UPI000DCD99E3|nr:tetratricopeptide repeat protein [Sinomicrobium sp. N-1-3-6]RAV30203.1 hypothetical protein DN748_05265 [Sinomicrobium sp. N-1-3-6]
MKKIPLLFISIIIVFIAHARDRKADPDSIPVLSTSGERIRYVNRLLENGRLNDKEEFRRFLKQAEDFAETSGDELLKKELEFVRKTARTYAEQNAEKRLEVFREIIRDYPPEHSPLYHAVCLHYIGQNEFVLERYGEAFGNLLKAQEIFERIGLENVPNIGKYLHDLALDYYFFKNYDEVIRFMKQSVALPRFNANLDMQRYNTLGMAYLKQSRLDSARIYLDTALRKALRYKDSVWVGITSGNLGQVFFRKEDYDRAYTYYNDYYRLNRHTYDYPEIPIEACLRLAALYMALDSMPQARDFIRRSREYLPNPELFRFGDQQRFEISKKEYYRTLYTYYTRLPDYRKALAYHDSLTTAEKLETDTYNSALIKLTENQLQLREHESRIALQQRESTRLRLRYGILIFAVFLFAVIGFTLYYMVRLRRRKEKEVMLERQRVTDLKKEKTEAELRKAREDIDRFVRQMNEKNTWINRITEELEQLKLLHAEEQRTLDATMCKLKKARILTDEDWMDFRNSFDTVFPEFKERIKSGYPALTDAELRYLMLLRLELEHKEMALVLGVSAATIRVTWNRVRKKLGGSPGDTPETIMQRLERNGKSGSLAG